MNRCSRIPKSTKVPSIASSRRVMAIYHPLQLNGTIIKHYTMRESYPILNSKPVLTTAILTYNNN